MKIAFKDCQASEPLFTSFKIRASIMAARMKNAMLNVLSTILSWFYVFWKRPEYRSCSIAINLIEKNVSITASSKFKTKLQVN